MTKRILLTGIGGNTAQGVARSLRKHPKEFTLIGADSDRYNVRFGFSYAKRNYLVPVASDEGYIPAVSRIVRKEEIDLVVPSPDAEVYEVSKHRDEVGCRVFLPSHEAIEVTRDKWLTYNALRGKVEEPRTLLVLGREDISGAFTEIGSPLWLRARRGAGGLRSLIAYNEGQAKFWVEYWRGYGEFTASEFLTGRNLGWIGLYKDGALIAMGGYLRLRYFMDKISPTGVTGNINLGVTMNDRTLNRAGTKVVNALEKRPNGVYNIDLKGDGFPKVTEINSGRFHMSSFTYTAAGLNLPYLYAKLALDEPVELPRRKDPMKAGVMTIRNTDNEALFVDADEVDKGILIP